MANGLKRIRPAAVAGRFYPDEAQRCADELHELAAKPDGEAPAVLPELPAKLVGAMVPHAGWVCSGSVAIRALKLLAGRSDARTVFLTGTVHTTSLNGPTLDSADAWHTPLGDVAVDSELQRAVGKLADVSTLDMAHQYEHSLEVVLPMIVDAFGLDVKVLPCLIPPHPQAHVWGEAIGDLLSQWSHPVAVVISTDLTHYGPNYGFTPRGLGQQGRRWAMEENDRRLLGMIEGMRAERIVAEVHQNRNACGPGAIAAGLEMARRLGSEHGYVLEHTDSTAQLEPLGHADANNSVGYAGVVFG